MKYSGSLHNHSEYSNLRLRDCIIHLTDLVDKAIELGHQVVAITDHECLSGHMNILEYYKSIKQEHPNFKLILGNEIYLCRNGLTQDNYDPSTDKYFHFILLAKDSIGHKQLRQISTRAWKRSYMYRIQRRVPTYYQDLEDIVRSNPGHLVATSACLGGWLDTKLLDETYPREKIIKWIKYIQSIFGNDNFYLELQPPAKLGNEQDIVNHKLINLSKTLNIPYIITTDSHYLVKEDAQAHSIYLKSQNGDREVESFYATTYMMSDEEIREYFIGYDEDVVSIASENILKIKEQCQDYELKKPLRIPELKWHNPKERNVFELEQWFKKIPKLETFYYSSYKGDKVLALEIIERLLENKNGDLLNDEMYQGIDTCLDVTWRSSKKNQAHWSAYFLNLQQIIDYIWESGNIVGPARGSGGGFVLLYVLGIIQINALRETTPLFYWRFLNPSRVTVLDIDIDISGAKREQILEYLRERYSEERMAGVAVFGTEGTKSAILTAARGLGMDVDEAQYLSSLVPADRGKIRTLKQCYYGDEDKGFLPVRAFVHEMDSCPDLWAIAQKIEGLVCELGSHAGGIIFVDEDFEETVSLMKTPKGTLVTGYELHAAEATSLIKYDLLSIEAIDKIQTCLELLLKDGKIEDQGSVQATYEKYIGIYNLERKEPKMWKMLQEHKIYSIFQMEKESGIKGIALSKPQSVDELAVLNSVIRLMAPEKGAEQPLDMWVRYRKDIKAWYREMKQYGLNYDEIDWISHHQAFTNGICESQEGMMQLLQEERLGGNSLDFADKARKAIAKKQGKLFDECEAEFYKNAKEKGCSEKLVHYIWDVALRVQRGYSFNRAHTLGYSLIGLQEMNLAYRFPIIYWNCACLISDSGSINPDSATDYKKMARAIGNTIKNKTKVLLPDINRAESSFILDSERNEIIYGLKGLVNVGEDVINQIINNRPYSSLRDFCTKVNLNKQPMLSLIKGGAFDVLEPDRKYAMAWYIWNISDRKKQINLQNLSTLIKKDLIPNEPTFIQSKKVFEFNRYLRDLCRDDTISTECYCLNERAINFLISIEAEDLIQNNLLNKKNWDKIYQKYMDVFRDWMKQNQQDILNALNDSIFLENWNKNAQGTLSAWEMEALCFYYHEHELAHINKQKYGLIDFNQLPEEPIVERYSKKGYPIYRIEKIYGTCIAKDQNKGTISLLTPFDVVNVKFRKEHFSLFDKQLSQVQENGKKKVVEKSWFNRGNKLIIQGIRRGEGFIAKKYSSTAGHTLYKINQILENGDVILQDERTQI